HLGRIDEVQRSVGSQDRFGQIALTMNARRAQHSAPILAVMPSLKFFACKNVERERLNLVKRCDALSTLSFRAQRGILAWSTTIQRSVITMSDLSRREFLKSSIATAVASGLSASLSVSRVIADSASLPIKKGVLLDMLPSKLSYADRFKLARDVGFE